MRLMEYVQWKYILTASRYKMQILIMQYINILQASALAIMKLKKKV